MVFFIFFLLMGVVMFVVMFWSVGVVYFLLFVMLEMFCFDVIVVGIMLFDGLDVGLVVLVFVGWVLFVFGVGVFLFFCCDVM